MILAIEPTWTGRIHAPGNAILLNIVKAAFPEQPLHIFAEAAHLKELQTILSAQTNATAQFHPIQLSPHYLHRPHIVSATRLFSEMGIIRRAFAQTSSSQECLLILLSATSTAIFAADLLSRLRRGKTFIQAQLHGNLNEVTAWRHSDPIRRALDLKSALAKNYHGRLRYLVLEQFIRDKLAELSPATAQATDVLPHPIAMQGHAPADVTLELPLRVGLVGLGSEEKGMGSFLEIAKRVKQDLGDTVRFHHIGSARPGADLSLYGLLEEPPSLEQLTRPDFLARLSRLHYVIFPLKERYYGLSASGTFLDAVAALKPVIATRIPLTQQFFREFGDIGYLCQDDEDIILTIKTIASKPDPDTYQAQVSALRASRAARLPDALVPTYRGFITSALPSFAP
ncbi:MAG TPA: glycosyltransferase [Rhizomicrobium sp.]|nr:glycosyltransferase [Rhizomicrobium sp.]